MTMEMVSTATPTTRSLPIDPPIFLPPLTPSGNPNEINLIGLQGPFVVLAQPSYDTSVQLNGTGGFGFVAQIR
ncbi:hypothetical protein [Sagittula sp. SSi028]|uniref:hypothetical protein n=1 Tax=Sagittula sp. SSi028 TaxID=3400636 RepID=UPI003AF5742B